MGNLENEIKLLDQAGVNFFHFDVMDGSFVPNFTMGPDMVKALRLLSNKLFDVHLMIKEPERFVDLFADAGADMISVHVEATKHLQRTLQAIRDRGLKAGVALNPATSLHTLDYVWDVVDYVVLMTVNPGFAGQKFVPSTYGKIKQLKEIIIDKQLEINIQVDGNISYETIPKVLENGADMLVCGTSSLFKKDKPLEQTTNELLDYISDSEKIKS